MTFNFTNVFLITFVTVVILLSSIGIVIAIRFQNRKKQKYDELKRIINENKDATLQMKDGLTKEEINNIDNEINVDLLMNDLYNTYLTLENKIKNYDTNLDDIVIGFLKEFNINKIENFREKGFKAVKLFCEPKTSENFWKRMGLIKFPDCGYTEHELTYYGVLIDVASTTYIKDADKIELWDVEPYEVDGKQPKWIWYIEFEADKLLYPIVHPCNCNWNLRWSRNDVVLKEEKVKYFTDKAFEVYRSEFLCIERL